MILFALPIISVCIIYSLWKHPSPGSTYASGFALPFVVLGSVAVAGILSIVIGLLVGSLKEAIVAFTLSLFLSVISIVTMIKVEELNSTETTNEIMNDLNRLLPAIHKNDSSLIQEKLLQLIKLDIATTVCILTSSTNTGGNGYYLSEDPQARPNHAFYFSLDQLFVVLRSIATLDIPKEQKIEAFYHVFLRLSKEQASLADLETWSKLFEEARLLSTEGFFSIPYRYQQQDPICTSASEEYFAQTLVQSWKDEGVLLWLNLGHRISRRQSRVILVDLRSAEVLRKVIASGVNINEPHPRSHEGGYLSDTLLNSISSSLVSRINEDSNPLKTSEFIRVLIQSGADKSTQSVTHKSPCDELKEQESYLNQSDSSKKKAYAQIKNLLCQKE